MCSWIETCSPFRPSSDDTYSPLFYEKMSSVYLNEKTVSFALDFAIFFNKDALKSACTVMNHKINWLVI